MTEYFGTDGVRGVVGEWPLVPEFCLYLGQVAGAVLGEVKKSPTVVIGRDTRQSGQMLQEALTAGFLASGANVIDLGVVPTPGVAWILRSIGAEAGVVISASHNPPEQNGIKFFGNTGRKLPEDEERRMEQLLQPFISGESSEGQNRFVRGSSKQGRLQDGKLLVEQYIQGLIDEHPGLNLGGMTIVLDCANGAAYQVAPEVFGRLGARTVVIHASPNGWNINASAGSEHVRRQVRDIGMLIEYYQADLGLAFDGDADRVILVDEKENLVDGDHMLGILARYLGQQGKLLSRSVVTTWMRNSGLHKYLEQLDIGMFETPVGDRYVVEKLLELSEAAPNSAAIGLGGEQSGHIVLVDEAHSTGDGVRTALYVIRALRETGQGSLSSFIAEVGKVPQIIASADVGHGPRMSKADLSALEARVLNDHPGLLRVNLRYSGTEPLFRVMLESDGGLDENALALIAIGLCRQMQHLAGAADGAIDILNSTRGGVIEVGR
ncbi:MAG: phosphoglucosamine mutase [Anaerolineales bacterium]|nr:phosphoglucosamine mutase [Anaerolineales bacterium]